MKAVIQRVEKAACYVDGEVTGAIEKGFLVLLGVMKGDTKKEAALLAKKIAGLRVFTDEADKMNLDLQAVNGGILLVSNFTLGADLTKSGKRPSFSDAAPPAEAKPLYEYMADALRAQGVAKVEMGIFGADMKLHMIADGPVTLLAEYHP